MTDAQTPPALARVVFACVHNAGRSQMSAALFNLEADPRLAQAASAGDACPYVPGLEMLDWPLDDPKHLPLEQVRRIRGDIRARANPRRGAWLGPRVNVSLSRIGVLHRGRFR